MPPTYWTGTETDIVGISWVIDDGSYDVWTNVNQTSDSRVVCVP